MTDRLECEKCGTKLSPLDVFGDINQTLCRTCWYEHREETGVPAPAWYKRELDHLEVEIKWANEALHMLEAKHKRLHSDYLKYYDIFGERREQMLKEGKR